MVTTDDFSARLEAARAGDEHAFAGLFRTVQPVLLRYLRTVGGALAEDVAADTWMNVVRDLTRFRGTEDKFQAWVFTIARARLVDARRRAARAPTPVDSTAVLAPVPDDVDVAESVEDLFSTEAALAIIGKLPPDQAEVVLLRCVVGLDVRDTARVVGKRPGTVRVVCHRALSRLRQMLEDSAASGDQATCNGIAPPIGRTGDRRGGSVG